MLAIIFLIVMSYVTWKMFSFYGNHLSRYPYTYNCRDGC